MEEFALKEMNLRGSDPLKIPLLCVHGEGDNIALFESCMRAMEWAQGEKHLISYPNERHVCVNFFQDLCPKMYDWMADRLKQ